MALALVNRSTEGKAPFPALPRARPHRRARGRLAAICLGLLGLLAALAWRGGSGPLEPLSLRGAAPAPAWIEIQDPAGVFRLEAPEFADAVQSYAALRHRTGGGRQDILEFGGAVGEAPAFRFVAYRPGGEAVPPQAFFVELARRAAEAGLAITRAAQPSMVATRFGGFEVAEMSLSGSGSAARECLGFRFNTMEPDIRFAGFACGTGEPGDIPQPKTALACLIDQIDLAPTAGDESLVWFFAAHAPGRSPRCGDETFAAGLRGSGR